MDHQAITNLIIKMIKDVVPELVDHTIGREDSMPDLGVDSMERGDIIVSTLEELELEIPMTQLHGPSNIGELADLIYEKLQ